MPYKESNFTTDFQKYIASYPSLFLQSAAFELKLTKKDSIPFSAVKLHQTHNLKLAKKRFIYKISDAAGIYGQRPFDCVYLVNAQAYVVICFYKPRQSKEFVMIDVNKFEAEALLSKRRSLTKERAKEIGTTYIL